MAENGDGAFLEKKGKPMNGNHPQTRRWVWPRRSVTITIPEPLGFIFVLLPLVGLTFSFSEWSLFSVLLFGLYLLVQRLLHQSL